MSAFEYISEKVSKACDYISWDYRNTTLGSKLVTPFFLLLRRERGTDFPYYFPAEGQFIQHKLEQATEFLNNFIHIHESERNKADFEQTFVSRFRYVLSNFHYYSNDTMANLYFEEKLPTRDYQRIKSNYNKLFFSWFSYNSLSGMFLVALNNHFFKCRKASLPLVLGATLTSMASLGLNYELSHQVMEKMFNVQVRRFGYGHFIHNKGDRYPKNVDFFAC
jgi:hypothetical protein